MKRLAQRPKYRRHRYIVFVERDLRVSASSICCAHRCHGYNLTESESSSKLTEFAVAAHQTSYRCTRVQNMGEATCFLDWPAARPNRD